MPCALSNSLPCEKVTVLLDHLNKLGSDTIHSEKPERENCSHGLFSIVQRWHFSIKNQTFNDINS